MHSIEDFENNILLRSGIPFEVCQSPLRLLGFFCKNLSIKTKALFFGIYLILLDLFYGK